MTEVREQVTKGARLSSVLIPFEACPLCGSPDFRLLTSADCSRHALYDPRLPPILDWMRCAACAHIFSRGYFSPAATEILLSRAHPFQQPGEAYEQKRFLAARIIERVGRIASPGDLWLDVGFGDGALLRTAQEFGFTAIGIDVRENVVKALRRCGVETHLGDFAAFALLSHGERGSDERNDRRFAVISMMDVLEHMPFPRDALATARELLAPGGSLVVSMPNANSPIWRDLTAAGNNPYWGEIEHYHNFGRARLYALLAETGFTPIRYAVSERYRACMEVVSSRQ